MYKRKLTASSFVRKSKLIIGLDLVADLSSKDSATMRTERDRLEQAALQVISQTAEHAVAFKINRHLILPLEAAQRPVELFDCPEGLACKLRKQFA